MVITQKRRLFTEVEARRKKSFVIVSLNSLHYRHRQKICALVKNNSRFAWEKLFHEMEEKNIEPPKTKTSTAVEKKTGFHKGH